MNTISKNSDYIVRATAANHQIRAFAISSTNTIEEARQRHNTSPIATVALGRLMSAGAMMGTMMKGDDDIITIQIKGDGPIGGLTVTADAKANVKGYVNHPEVMLPLNSAGQLDVEKALGIGVLSVIKDIGLKEPYVGDTILVTSDVTQDITYYFATSEQVPTSVGLSVIMSGAKILNGTCLGKGNKIHHNAILGTTPQDFHYTGEDSRLIIGDNNDIRENVVISRATHADGASRIGNENYLME